jgi:hypothetical protein
MKKKKNKSRPGGGYRGLDARAAAGATTARAAAITE